MGVRTWKRAACIGMLLFVALVGGARVVRADEGPPGLEMSTMAAFGGRFKYGEWLPVWVELENSGQDREIEVRVRVTGTWGGTTFAAPVALPSGSRKRVVVYVLPNNYSRALSVEAVEGDTALLTQQVAVQPHLNMDYVIGLIAPERGAMGLVPQAVDGGGRRRNVVLFDLTLEELPERVQAWRTLDCLVLNDVDSSALSTGQRQALASWVGQGGRLVLGGGAGARRVAAAIPAHLLPVDPGDLIELDSVSSLESLGGGEPIRVPGPFVAASGQVRSGRVLAAEGSLPLVVERAVGLGQVDAVALDLSGSPFDAWAGTGALWTALADLTTPYPGDIPPDMSFRQMISGQMNYALSNLPALALPSVTWLALLLSGYVVLVGPANYLLLRWRRKLHWAWVTIPALTVVFAGGAFGLGYALRGTDLILNKIAVAVLQADGTAWANTFMGVFSPARESYEVEVAGDGLLSPLQTDRDPFSSGGAAASGDVVFLQGQPSRVRGLSVNQWSMQTLFSEGAWADVGAVRAELSVSGDALVGTVRNETAFALRDVVIVQGASFARLGDLEPGAEAEVELGLGRVQDQVFGPPLSYRLFEEAFRSSGPGGPPREAQVKQSVLDSVFMSGTKLGSFHSRWSAASFSGSTERATLLGWFDEAPPAVTVAGRAPVEQTLALLIVPLDYRFEAGEGLHIPPGLVAGTVVQMPTEGGLCGAAGVAAVYIGRGEAVFEFRLPAGLRGDVSQVLLEIGADGGGMAPPVVSLYDWDAGAWADLPGASLGRTEVDGAKAYVSDDGLARVRLASDGVPTGCYYVDLGVDGER